MTRYDVVVIGAGAAGMMCAVEAGRQGRRVLVIEHGAKPDEKIRISGGGRCNFTNLHANDDITQGTGGYLSENPRFCVSALKRYRPEDFIARLDAHGIAWHEKTLGQLFLDDPVSQIVDMFLTEMAEASVELRLSTTARDGDGFTLLANDEVVSCASLVVATGGKSIPKMGVTGFAYEVARKFGVPVTETRPALVPLTFEPDLLETTKALSGVSVDARVSCGKRHFDEAVLFTHRGLSGPVILQISYY